MRKTVSNSNQTNEMGGGGGCGEGVGGGAALLSWRSTFTDFLKVSVDIPVPQGVSL